MISHQPAVRQSLEAWINQSSKRQGGGFSVHGDRNKYLFWIIFNSVAMNKGIVFFMLYMLAGISTFGQLGVNTDNSLPDASAMLDLKSTNRGFLPPRVALTSINSALPVTAPAIGLLVYNTAVAGTAPNNVMPGYYCWNGAKWTPVAPPQGTNVGDMLYWNGSQWVGAPVGSNGQVLTLANGVPSWGAPSSLCGMPVTINHVAGAVAPVSKTVTYNTVTNIPGELAKCWIASNLGADHQAASLTDVTEPSAGWYWQFNRKQGYRHDGTTRTPGTAWIGSISENSDWVAASDPCTIELGGNWRIPTSTEWTNVDASGNWTDWTGPWNSGLKLHAAGYLFFVDGSLLDLGTYGYCWSNTQNNATTGWYLYLYVLNSGMNYTGHKPNGFPIRYIRDI